ncbi:MAG: restriction endonuclease subunit S [Succinivibrio sp.]|nr:restriction endonuclease subunit S [Succinivibrio sp.]
MNTEIIKKKILDLAIRGKLVEQIPEEGSAEDLYNHIQEEKTKLIAEGKINKEKPLPEISEKEIPFDIPENWKWVRLSEIYNFIDYRGKTPLKSQSGVFLITASNIKQGYMDYTRKEYISEEEFNNRTSRGITHKGDLLFTTEAPLGNSAICDLEHCSCGQRVITFQRINNIIQNKLFMFFILSRLFQNQLLENCTGSTAKGIKAEKLKTLIIPFPPFKEQKRIIEKVEEIFSRIDVIEKAKANLSRDGNLLEKKILDLTIRGKLVEQRPEEGTAEELYAQIQEEKRKLIADGKIKKEKPLPEISEDEIPFGIPVSWKWVRLKQLVDIQNGDRGKNYPAKETLHEQGIPFISAINLEHNTVISDSKLKCLDDIQYERLRAGKLQVNDLVVCIRGSLGKHAKYPFEKGAIASSLVILRKYLNDDTIAEFIAYYLDSWLFFEEIGKYNNGTAQPNLAANDLEKFVIPLPPLAEQKRIVAKIEELLPYCDKLK